MPKYAYNLEIRLLIDPETGSPATSVEGKLNPVKMSALKMSKSLRPFAKNEGPHYEAYFKPQGGLSEMPLSEFLKSFPEWNSIKKTVASTLVEGTTWSKKEHNKFQKALVAMDKKAPLTMVWTF
jgi:hypothetical protein